MAVVAMVLSASVLLACAVVFARRLTRGPEGRRQSPDCSGGDGGLRAAAASDTGADCSGIDAGGCDGGGGD